MNSDNSILTENPAMISKSDYFNQTLARKSKDSKPALKAQWSNNQNSNVTSSVNLSKSPPLKSLMGPRKKTSIICTSHGEEHGKFTFKIMYFYGFMV